MSIALAPRSYGRAAAFGVALLLFLGCLCPRARAQFSCGPATTAALTTCLGNFAAGTSCDLPVGAYEVDNSTLSPCTVNVTVGSTPLFRMEPGAYLYPSTQSNNLLKFIGANGALFDGVAYAYSGTVWTRSGGITFEINNSNNPTIRHFEGIYGPEAALWISNSPNVLIDDVKIFGPGADGLHLENTTNARVTNVHAEETNDDGFAITNGVTYPFGTGAIASGIWVKNAYGNCFRFEGMPDVIASDLFCDTSALSGISVDTNLLSYPSATFSEVRVNNFEVKHAGAYGQLSNGGFGLNITGAGTGNVYFSNGTVSYSQADGIFSDNGNAFLSLSDVKVYRSLGDGIHIGSQTAELHGVTTQYSYERGVYISPGSLVIGSGIRSINDVLDPNAPDTSSVEVFGPTGPIRSMSRLDNIDIVDTSPYLDPDLVTITNPGSGYTAGAAPAVTIGGTPSCQFNMVPIVTAVAGSTGTVSSVQVGQAGVDCTGSVALTVAAPSPGPGATATLSGALAGTMGGVGVVPVFGTSFMVSANGSGYDTNTIPTISFAAAPCIYPPTFGVTFTGTGINSVAVSAPGRGCINPAGANLVFTGGTDPTTVAAVTATLNGAGALVLTITNAGSGYKYPPEVSASATGCSTAPSLQARVSPTTGKLIGFYGQFGAGCTGSPSVHIYGGADPATSAAAMVTSVTLTPQKSPSNFTFTQTDEGTGLITDPRFLISQASQLPVITIADEAFNLTGGDYCTSNRCGSQSLVLFPLATGAISPNLLVGYNGTSYQTTTNQNIVGITQGRTGVSSRLNVVVHGLATCSFGSSPTPTPTPGHAFIWGTGGICVDAGSSTTNLLGYIDSYNSLTMTGTVWFQGTAP